MRFSSRAFAQPARSLNQRSLNLVAVSLACVAFAQPAFAQPGYGCGRWLRLWAFVGYGVVLIQPGYGFVDAEELAA